MLVPTVHLNGTSAENLIRQLIEARRALRNALQAVDETAPNGRDYYPQGDGAIGIATREHLRRLERIQAVLGELTELLEGVQEQADAGMRRNPRRNVPIDSEGPYGPYALARAEQFARIGATKGEHDRVVTHGAQPTGETFDIVRRYRRGTGERIL